MEEAKTTKKALSIYAKLVKIQNEFTSPKDKTNEFGKFKYRNCEAMCEQLKPILDKYNCTLFFSDVTSEVKGMVYLVTSITFIDCESEKQITITTPCPYDLGHKGMSAEQCGGSTLSYAHKYALSSLFLVDNADDPDSMPPSEAKRIDYCRIMNQLRNVSNLDELGLLWKSNPEWQNDAKVKDLFSTKKKQFV